LHISCPLRKKKLKQGRIVLGENNMAQLRALRGATGNFKNKKGAIYITHVDMVE